MFTSFLSSLLIPVLITTVSAQRAGFDSIETHPKLSWQKCTKTGGCVTQGNATITLDADWRWVHGYNSFSDCYTGNSWNPNLCPDPDSCAKNCALEGADYAATYGIRTSGNALTLKFVNRGSGADVGSRIFLMHSDTQYEMFNPLNQEIAFDVDVSNLPCGLSGGLHFAEMDADGGMAKNSGNKAGAKYGTGYCDSQCRRDVKFINGAANNEDWVPSPVNQYAGTGRYGACCNEMDIWEANSAATAFIAHPCTSAGLSRCEGSTCDSYNTVCDPDGCDFNPYRLGNKTFYGKGQVIDTSRKFTVVTQFITSDGTATGDLSEIRRLYVQNGVVIQNSRVNIPGINAYDSISEEFCDAEKKVFGDYPQFQNRGGLKQLGKAMANGMVLVFSIYDDYARNMLWLDSAYPQGADPTKLGILRGSCDPTSGVPAELEVLVPDSSVTFSNVRFGDIGVALAGSLRN